MTGVGELLVIDGLTGARRNAGHLDPDKVARPQSGESPHVLELLLPQRRQASTRQELAFSLKWQSDVGIIH
jgi:hypothetical protein